MYPCTSYRTRQDFGLDTADRFTVLPIRPSLLFLLPFHLFLMRLDDRACDMSRDDIIVIQFHGEVAAPTGDGTELRGVARHLRHRHMRNNNCIPALRFSPLHAPAASVEIAHHIAHI